MTSVLEFDVLRGQIQIALAAFVRLQRKTQSVKVKANLVMSVKRRLFNIVHIIAPFPTGFLILLYTIIPIIYKSILQIQLSALMFGCAWSAGGKCS